MLDLFIIEAIERQEREEKQEQPQIELPLPYPYYEENNTPEASPVPSDRGVVIIEG